MYATIQRPSVFRLPRMATKTEAFGTYIKRHRLRAGLKQEALANKARY